ncbi:hypothetical protein HOLleu_14226 [Holothuria leucospilota]|uniref:Uncharacterized protein n=1 Tax=Holothuria leucospilota TaxID=206669 RepID=A0A9Q1C8K7_HOLLE|nr:hypothetical protein HOLleu_14226 [Holothuria leucospilota]
MSYTYWFAHDVIEVIMSVKPALNSVLGIIIISRLSGTKPRVLRLDSITTYPVTTSTI